MSRSDLDVLVLAPHPDDAELACGGTILQLTDAGRRVAIADMTRGESATLGTPQLRAREAEEASRLLGLAERVNLELPDGRLRDDETALAAVVGVLRRLRPRLLLAPLEHDLHPDHAAAGAIARRAWFAAGLAKLHSELGPPHRPSLLLRYPLHDDIEPTLCVDVAAVAERKAAVLRCYASQVPKGDRGHLARLDFAQRARARDLHYGARIGRPAAEPYASVGPLPLQDLRLLLPSGSRT